MDREPDQEESLEPPGSRIRCPLGGWSPRKDDRCACSCGHEWNTFDIESRDDMIRVKLNDYLVSQYAGEKGRSKTGPIGLQLHDKTSVVMFRNIRIKEVKPHK